MKKIIFILLLSPLLSAAQEIPNKARTILVKGVSFNEVCSALMDSGYVIESKDNELMTARTEPIEYPKYWNGAYKIQIRVKDSVAYFTGLYKVPYLTGIRVGSGLYDKNPWSQTDYIYHHVNRKGKTFPKSMFGYPFLLMNKFVAGFGKEMEYR